MRKITRSDSNNSLDGATSPLLREAKNSRTLAGSRTTMGNAPTPRDFPQNNPGRMETPEKIIWISSLSSKEENMLKQSLQKYASEGIKIPKIDFRGLNLTGIKMPGVHLKKVDLTQTNLCNSNFTNAKFDRPVLNETKFDRANLSGTKFNIPLMSKCDFTKSFMNDQTEILISDHELENSLNNLETIDLLFNHIHNGSGSILKTIHSIPCLKIRLELMNKIASFILKHPNKEHILNSIHLPFIDILLNTPESLPYRKKEIENNEWTRQLSILLLEHILNEEEYNILFFNRLSSSLFPPLLDYIQEKLDFSEMKWLEVHHTVLQILLYKMSSCEDQMSDQAIKIKNNLIELPFIQPLVLAYKSDLSFDEETFLTKENIDYFRELTGRSDLTIGKSIVLAAFDQEEKKNTLFFLSPEEGNGLVFDKDYCERWIFMKTSHATIRGIQDVYYYKRIGESIYESKAVTGGIARVLSPWPWLTSQMEGLFYEPTSFEALESMFLPKELESPTSNAKERNEKYCAILKKTRTELDTNDTKLLTDTQQADLIDCLAHLYNHEGRLRQKHLDDLYDIYSLKSNTQEKIVYFLFLKIMEFVFYSCSHACGGELKSPDALRLYPYKLMEEIEKIGIPSLLLNKWGEWKNKLINLQTNTCMAGLFNEMNKEAKKVYRNPELTKLYNMIIPVAWRSF